MKTRERKSSLETRKTPLSLQFSYFTLLLYTTKYFGPPFSFFMWKLFDPFPKILLPNSTVDNILVGFLFSSQQLISICWKEILFSRPLPCSIYLLYSIFFIYPSKIGKFLTDSNIKTLITLKVEKFACTNFASEDPWSNPPWTHVVWISINHD